MTNEASTRMAGAALCSLLLASEAVGAIVCVSPAGGPCQTTIQAGVDAAGPGDTVSVLPGTYYENVVVPLQKERLQIVGSNKLTVILDPSPYADLGNANPGTGITVDAPKVQIKNLTIRNGTTGILGNVDGLVAQGLVINGANLGGITSTGWYAQIALNEIRNTATGVYALGFGTVVRSNLLAANQVGLRLEADGIQALSNRVYTGETGILGLADGLLVKLNDIRDQSDTGIQVTGRSPVVQGNKVDGGHSVAGITVNCTDCFGGTVASNKVSGGRGFGLLMIADGPGLVVDRNTLLRTRLGLSLNGSGIRATKNTASEVGQDHRDDCFELFGAKHVLLQNAAKACAAAGFYVAGDAHLLEGNTTVGTFENGITAAGDDGAGGTSAGTTLEGNKVMGSAGQGIAIMTNAVDMFVRNNVSTKNRLDFCNDGTGTVLSGNTFPTSADTVGTDCVIVH